jgi:2-amino-4-hydroxy-6-hydroxymethyldihydropteridine diphosphokinase
MRVVRISSVHETKPVDAPPGSPNFFNLVIAGYTRLGPRELLDSLLAIEKKLGRVRRERNAPRTIDLDLILHSAHVMKMKGLTLPHPRYLDRTFVMDPIRELRLTWVDPLTRKRIDAPVSASGASGFRGAGTIRRRLEPALSFREALLYFLTRAAVSGSGPGTSSVP